MPEERTIVKKVKNATLWSDDSIDITGVRLSHPHLDEAWARNPTDRKRYSATFILPKTTHREAKDLCKEVYERQMKEKKITFLKPDAKFLRDGDQTGKPEYAGCYIVASGESNPPAIRTRILGERLTPAQVKTKFYPGCLVNALVEPWIQDNTHGKRANASLRAVQFWDDAERIGGKHGQTDDEIDETFQYADGGTGGYDDDGEV